MAGPVQRHGGHAVAQVHPAAYPGTRCRIVLAAPGRAHLAQFRVDHRAVVALVVVLGEDLPVGRGVVVVLPGYHQALHLIGRDDVLQRAQRVRERGGRARTVDEDQPVPFGDRQLDQAPLTGHETRPVLEARGGPQAPVQPICPGVIGADDHLLLGGGPARQQLMTTVPAAVRERMRRAVLRPGEQDAPGAHALGAHVAGAGHLAAAAHAHPATAEHVSLLPGEDRRVDVGGAGQHPAFPERPQGLCHRGGVERGRRVHRLTDHTVKPKQRATRCPVSNHRSGYPDRG